MMPRPTFVLAITAFSVACASCGANAEAPRPSHHVVSYVVSAGVVPDRGVPAFPLPPLSPVPDHPWQWRIFDPVTGRDTLLMNLRPYPLSVHWDCSFTAV